MTIWEQVGQEIEAFTGGIRELPVSSPVDAVMLRQELESRFDDFGTPMPLADLTRQVADLLRRYSVQVIHPRYFGLFNPSVSHASIVGDTLTALYNPQLAAWSHSPIANEIFCRHHDAPRRAFHVSASYMPSESGADTIDPYVSTLQWTRRAIGLKLFMSIAEQGGTALSDQIDRQARLGDILRSKLQAAGWEVVNDTMLSVVCVTNDDIRAGRVSTSTIVAAVQARGRVWISDVLLGRRECAVRACITSFRTDEADLDVLVDELARARQLPQIEHR